MSLKNTISKKRYISNVFCQSFLVTWFSFQSKPWDQAIGLLLGSKTVKYRWPCHLFSFPLSKGSDNQGTVLLCLRIICTHYEGVKIDVFFLKTYHSCFQQTQQAHTQTAQVHSFVKNGKMNYYGHVKFVILPPRSFFDNFKTRSGILNWPFGH